MDIIYLSPVRAISDAAKAAVRVCAAGPPRLYRVLYQPLRSPKRSAPMSTKFVCFINPHTNKPILVNPAHVRTASEVDPQKVALVTARGRSTS